MKCNSTTSIGIVCSSLQLPGEKHMIAFIIGFSIHHIVLIIISLIILVFACFGSSQILRLEYGSVSKYLLDEKEECSDLEGYTMVMAMVIHLGDNSVFTIVYLSLTWLLM
jgi:hypothetical protein